MTFGVRNFREKGVPFRSWWGNTWTAIEVRLAFGFRIADTQTGLRAIPARLFAALLAVPGERFEYEARIFRLLHRLHEPLEQVPIRTIYLANNRASHFRPLRDTLLTQAALFFDFRERGDSMRDVAFTCDDNGAKFLRVAVWSLLTHYRGAEPIRINVLVGFGGHSAENRRALAELVAKFPGTVVRYVDVEPAVKPYADLIMSRENSRWNIFTWTPIFGPDLLPDVTGNLIHFDIDLLFNADVSPLFEMDLGDKLFAVAYEYNYLPGSRHNAVWDDGILPPSVERYFNTGVVVFNTMKCREEQTARQIVEWYRAHYDIADRIEQDAYNALFWNRVVPLPVKWNLHDRQLKYFATGDLSEKYWFGNPPRECLEAALNPCILHFWGPKKPWKPSHRPYRKLYHAAMCAVGLTSPKEPLLAPYHNLVNAIHLAQIRRRFAKGQPAPKS